MLSRDISYLVVSVEYFVPEIIELDGVQCRHWQSEREPSDHGETINKGKLIYDSLQINITTT